VLSPDAALAALLDGPGAGAVVDLDHDYPEEA
jgi:hypothetical protein